MAPLLAHRAMPPRTVLLLLQLVLAGAALAPPSEAANRKTRPSASQFFDVRSFGAKGDGKSDDTSAFAKAFAATCAGGDSSTLVIPRGKTFLLNGALKLSGPCKGTPLYIQLDGLVQFDAVARAYGSSIQALWEIAGVATLRVGGRGTIHGKGADWWKKSFRPHLFQVTKCTDVKVYGITTVDPPRMHVNFQYSQRIVAQALTTKAPSDSPNTDSIHIGNCLDVLLTQTTLHSGDDCVSIVGDTRDVVVTGVTCTAGHGYSIGSLGYGGDTVCIDNITVADSYLEGTTNGLRIKSYQGGQGLVSNVAFRNIRVKNVRHPIIINQFYCDKKPCSSGASSAVALHNIQFSKIVGTSTDSPSEPNGGGVSVLCDPGTPCSGLSFDQVNVWSTTAGTRLKPLISAGFGSVSRQVSPAGLAVPGSTPPGSKGDNIRSQAAKCGVKNLSFKRRYPTSVR